jgi:hypothetical protein
VCDVTGRSALTARGNLLFDGPTASEVTLKNTFVNFTNRVQQLYATHPAESVEVDALLTHLHEQNQSGVPVCITDLVRADRFGTLPTLSKRLHEMEARGLIRVTPGADRRTRLVTVDQAGLQLLDERAALLREALEAAGRKLESASTH